jgi:hypothetical protein
MAGRSQTRRWRGAIADALIHLSIPDVPAARRVLVDVLEQTPPPASRPSQPLPAILCEWCGTTVQPQRPHRRFCSDRCRRTAWRRRATERKP